jgi:hypothetical protein
VLLSDNPEALLGQQSPPLAGERESERSRAPGSIAQLVLRTAIGPGAAWRFCWPSGAGVSSTLGERRTLVTGVVLSPTPYVGRCSCSLPAPDHRAAGGDTELTPDDWR